MTIAAAMKTSLQIAQKAKSPVTVLTDDDDELIKGMVYL